jgi:hypothetical protein
VKRPTIEQLSQQVQRLESELDWMRRVLSMHGINGLWCSPEQAGKLLNVSRDRIMREIRRAEEMRVTKKPGDLKMGVHYRNIQDPEAGQPTWQINVQEFEKLLTIAPEHRKL